MSTFKNDKIKALRLAGGFTQQQYAEKIGVARTTYADYESGRIQPSLEKIQHMCRIFNLQLTDIMTVDNNTGIDVSNVKTKRKMTDEEKILIIEKMQKKEELFNMFNDMCFKISDADFSEKSMILPIVTYLRNQYAPTEQDIDLKKRIERSGKR